MAVVATLGGKPMAFAVALNFSAVLPFALRAAFWKRSALSDQLSAKNKELKAES